MRRWPLACPPLAACAAPRSPPTSPGGLDAEGFRARMERGGEKVTELPMRMTWHPLVFDPSTQVGVGEDPSGAEPPGPRRGDAAAPWRSDRAPARGPDRGVALVRGALGGDAPLRLEAVPASASAPAWTPRSSQGPMVETPSGIPPWVDLDSGIPGGGLWDSTTAYNLVMRSVLSATGDTARARSLPGWDGPEWRSSLERALLCAVPAGARSR